MKIFRCRIKWTTLNGRSCTTHNSQPKAIRWSSSTITTFTIAWDHVPINRFVWLMMLYPALSITEFQIGCTKVNMTINLVFHSFSINRIDTSQYSYLTTDFPQQLYIISRNEIANYNNCVCAFIFHVYARFASIRGIIELARCYLDVNRWLFNAVRLI